jgi:hypothetical protein
VEVVLFALTRKKEPKTRVLFVGFKVQQSALNPVIFAGGSNPLLRGGCINRIARSVANAPPILFYMFCL